MTELLAPAGNMRALKAAVACGADAVYLGTKDFNARSKADNFSEEQLRLAVSYCHERGVRVYVTLNTLVKTSEFSAAENTVRYASDAGVDAFLVQDLGMYLHLRDRFPDVSFHTSTQMGVHNLPGALMAEKLGFDRVVLSREALPADISAIKKHTSLEVEFFVHGAHCVSFSGNCYFSALVSGYSGNRGKCMQLCRKRYTLTSGRIKKSGYMLSAKDICLLPDLKKLAALGVDSLKIEGRLRSAEYVGAVTDVYRRALDDRGEKGDTDILKTVFNRGNFSHAYIDGDRPDIIYPVQQNHIGVKVADITGTSGNRLFVSGGYRGRAGDGYKVLRCGREACGAECGRGGFYSGGRAAKGDSLHLTRSAFICERVAEKIRTADNTGELNKIGQILRKNRSNMSDIVRFPYALPESYKIAVVDEYIAPEAVKESDAVILSPRTYDADSLKKCVAKFGKPILLDMPVEARGADVDILENIVGEDIFDGYVANNIYALEMCKDKRILLGTGMNSISALLDYPKIMSPEAAEPENGALIYAYGRQTLMHLTHCPLRQLGYNCGNCGGCDAPVLTDEFGGAFPMRRHKIFYCYWELLNSRMQNLLPRLDRRRHKRLVLDLRGVDKVSANEILRDPYAVRFDEKNETYGRFGKGVK